MLVGPRVRRVRRYLPIWSGLRSVQRVEFGRRGYRFGRTLSRPTPVLQPDATAEPANPLETYFDAHHEGRGIWKWRHYFDVYHRHLSKFIGRDVSILEIGIFSGGSLQMWKHYFGPQCRIYGVDIEPACRSYEDEATRIFIGDQADPEFWREFLSEVSSVDVVIDDGGHETHQQIATFEALFPHIRPGGVYICEDIGGTYNRFIAYMHGVTRNLYSPRSLKDSSHKPFQEAVHGVHYYPAMVVIVKREVTRIKFGAEKHGTEWAPFIPHGAPGPVSGTYEELTR